MYETITRRTRGSGRASGVCVVVVLAVIGLGACGSADDAPGRTAPSSTPTPSTVAVAVRHEFAAAVAARDLERLVATFADDVEVIGPVFDEPFVGRPTAERLFAVLAETFADIRVTTEAHSAEHTIVGFDARVGGFDVQVVDTLTFDASGRIRRLVVTMRPLEGTSALAAAVAPHLPAIRGSGA